MAFAVVDDGKVQLKLWKSLPARLRRDAGHIRDALTEAEVDASDRRVRFVTLQAYEAAGGATRRDLFTDGESGVFILQPDVLNDLVQQKLEAVRDAIAAEGWAWTDVRENFDYAERSQFRTIHQEDGDLPGELQAEMDALEAEREGICERDEESVQARLDEIAARLDVIEEQRPSNWPEGTFETAGAVITLGYGGTADITRGLVRREDEKREQKLEPKDPNALSKALVRSLKAQRSAAISAEIAANTDIALAAIVHTLAADVFFTGEGRTNCLSVTSTPAMPEDNTALARQILSIEQAYWQEHLPQSIAALWKWCVKQDRDTLLDLLAFCAALCVDAVSHEDAFFADAITLDMRKYFTPTATNYFAHVSKTQIIQALSEAKGAIAPAWERAKKSELAAIAERELKDSGWLPAILRAA